MKFGGHIYLWVERWSDAELDLLDRAKNLGCDILEVALGDDIQFTPRLLRQRAIQLDLELTIGPGGAWPMDCDISADDPAHRVRGLAWHQRLITLAAESGASAYCGALYGHPGQSLRRRPPPDEWPRTAENLHFLAEHAARAGVKLVIEPMSRFRTHLVNTPQQAVDLVRRADHPNLAVLLDTFHLITEVRDYAAAIHAVGPLLWGLHAAENDRGVPGGGLVPWREIFVALAAVNADARVLLETYNTARGDFAFTRGVYQDLCPDGDEHVRHGLRFLKQFA